MQLSPERLNDHLGRALAPAYLIAGDEPLQLGETADAVRHQARARGFVSREIIEPGSEASWNDLAVAADSLSLFSERRIIDLRLASPKIGVEGGKTLSAYLERPPEDTLLLITCPKLDRAQLASKWVKRLEKVGVLIQVWPVTGPHLLAWVDRRLRGRGLVPESGVVPMLAERVEGNLLAAAQEIEKMLLLHGPGPLSAEQLAEFVSDNARFDVYDLVDTVLQGRVGRVQRLLYALRSEGVPDAVVLWALTREIRSMARMSAAIVSGNPVDRVMGQQRVWEKRKPLVRQGLARLRADQWQSLLKECAGIDRILKGQGGTRDVWEALLTLGTRMAGSPSISDRI